MALKQIGGLIESQPLNDNFTYLDGKLLFGNDTAKPAPGQIGRIYIATDTKIIYEDTGTVWQAVGVYPHASTHASGGSDPITPAAIGAVPKLSAIPNGTDLNTIVDSGFYRLEGNSFLNAPTDIGFGQLIVCHGGADTIFQIVTGFGTNEFYMRNGNPPDVGGSGTWQPWRRLWHDGNAGPFLKGTGSPEGVVTAPVGAIYQRIDGGAASTLYVKESGTGNTGWKAVQTA